MRNKTPAASRFEVDERTGCWVWTGGFSGNGYGNAQVNGRQIAAHRMMFQDMVGASILPGFLACHKCDNPKCVWPGHIFLGTPKDNTQDCIRKGRFKAGPRQLKEYCKRGHSMANASVNWSRGYINRHCRICASIRLKEKRRNKNG